MASIIKVDKIAQASGTPEFTIPTVDGTAKSALITDGSGVLSFATGTPSSSNFLRGDGTWQTVTTTALTGSTNTWIPTITAANALTGTANFTYDGNILDVKNSGTASSIKLYCESSNAHAQEIKAAPHAGSSAWTLTLPPTVPSVSGQALTATTAGVASWTTVADATPRWLAYVGSAQALSSNSNSTYEFDTEVYDSDSAFDTGTYKFTVPVGEAGVYFGYSVVYHQGTTSGAHQLANIKLSMGGKSFWYEINTNNNFGVAFSTGTMGLAVLAEGDTCYCKGKSIFTSGTVSIGPGQQESFFGGWRVA